MGVEWYDLIARRNGGYKSNAVFKVEGLSGEAMFEKRLIEMLPRFNSVLDSGCGHGEFTIKMAGYAKYITGFDNSRELLQIAESLKEHYRTENVEFVYATTKEELPFQNGQFDLIYNRRGPTSILNHSRVLAPGGTIFGIHPVDLRNPSNFDKVLDKLDKNGFVDFEMEEFKEAVSVFPNEPEFTKFISAIPGNPDFSLPEHRLELEKMIEEHRAKGRLEYRDWKVVWSAWKA